MGEAPKHAILDFLIGECVEGVESILCIETKWPNNDNLTTEYPITPSEHHWMDVSYNVVKEY